MNIRRLIDELEDLLETEEDLDEGTQVFVGKKEVSQVQVQYDDDNDAIVGILIDD